MTVSFVSIFTR